ncbi:MAG: hypothetical protein WC932_06325 [archaeon]|jgi:hypothetical protein
MNKWEIEVCKRNPEINQRRLDLIEHLDGTLWRIRTYRKFIDKEELDNKEKLFIENKLKSWGLIK